MHVHKASQGKENHTLFHTLKTITFVLHPPTHTPTQTHTFAESDFRGQERKLKNKEADKKDNFEKS